MVVVVLVVALKGLYALRFSSMNVLFLTLIKGVCLDKSVAFIDAMHAAGYFDGNQHVLDRKSCLRNEGLDVCT